MPCTDCNRFYPSQCHAMGVTVDRAPGRCDKVRCMACGELRCHGEGTGNGRCKGCHYGMLPGWSGAGGACSYQGCAVPAVYDGLPGSKRKCCRAHGDDVLRRQRERRAGVGVRS